MKSAQRRACFDHRGCSARSFPITSAHAVETFSEATLFCEGLFLSGNLPVEQVTGKVEKGECSVCHELGRTWNGYGLTRTNTDGHGRTHGRGHGLWHGRGSGPGHGHPPWGNLYALLVSVRPCSSVLVRVVRVPCPLVVRRSPRLETHRPLRNAEL